METQYSAIEKLCDQDTSDMVKLKLIPRSDRKYLDTGLYAASYIGAASYIQMCQINKRSTWIIGPDPLFVGRSTWLLDLHPLFDGRPFGIIDSRILFVKRRYARFITAEAFFFLSINPKFCFALLVISCNASQP